MKQEEHAARIWLILIAAARDRRTLTYELLGKEFDLPARSTAEALAHIMYYCAANKLPPLTVLVVSKESGRPSEGLSTSADFDKDREAVYRFCWIDQAPPRPEELRLFATKLQSPLRPSPATTNAS